MSVHGPHAVTVFDAEASLPPSPGSGGREGRNGLLIVGNLADDWGTVTTDAEKGVWFRRQIPPGSGLAPGDSSIQARQRQDAPLAAALAASRTPVAVRNRVGSA